MRSIPKIRSRQKFTAKEDKDSLGRASGWSRDYLQACLTNKNG
jgi:hypothetical protein